MGSGSPDQTDGTVLLSGSPGPARDPAVAPTRLPDATTLGLTDLTIVDRVHYEILGEFKRGGLGKIIRAIDRRTGRMVAIKEMLPGRPDAAPRFCREALITANLEHPAIVPVYEVGRWPEGEPFYAMKLLASRTLDDAIAAAPTLRDRVALVPSLIVVADAIAYAHHRLIIHRDLKPSNVLLGAFGDTVVIDWGLAKRLDRDRDDETAEPAKPTGNPSDLTQDGAIMGTLLYMPPEQALGDPVDARADVYALGAMLYHLVTGRPPFHDAKSHGDILIRLANGPPPSSARDLEPDAPADLLSMIDKAMSRRREDRYCDARELADDLRRFQTGRLVAARRYSPAERLVRWLRRHRAAATAAVATLLLAVVGTILYVRREQALYLAAERSRQSWIENGRQELIADHAMRALPYLARAYAADPRDPTVRFLVARAMQALDAEVVALSAHGPVRSAAITPHGDRVVSVGEDGTARLWDATTGSAIVELAHGGAVDCTAFSADGAVLTVGAGKSRLWDATGAPIGEVAATPKAQCGTAITRDGSAMVFADARTISIASFRTGQIEARGEHLHTVLSARVLDVRGSDVATAPALVTGARDGAVGLFDPRPWWLEGHVGDVLDARGYVTEESVRIVSRDSEGGAALWDRDTLVGWLVFGDAARVAIHPATHLVVVALDDGSLRLFDAWDGAPRATLTDHVAPIAAISFSGDGRRFATASDDGVVRVWDAETAIPTATFDGLAMSEQALDFDGRRLVAVGDDGIARVLDVERGRVLAFALDRDAAMPAFSADGRRLCAGDTEWDLVIRRSQPITAPCSTEQPIDRAPAELRRLLDEHRGALSIEPGGGRVAVADCEKTRVFEIATGRQVAEIPCASCIESDLRFGAGVLVLGCPSRSDGAPSTETARLADLLSQRAGSRLERDWAVWRVAPAQRVRELSGTPLAFDPQGHHLAIARGDTVELVDVMTGDVAASMPGAIVATTQTTVELSPDGTRLVTDRELRDTRTGRVVGRLPQSTETDAFSADGSWLLASRRDPMDYRRRFVEVWDVRLETRTPAEVARLVEQRARWRLVSDRLVQSPR